MITQWKQSLNRVVNGLGQSYLSLAWLFNYSYYSRCLAVLYSIRPLGSFMLGHLGMGHLGGPLGKCGLGLWPSPFCNWPNIWAWTQQFASSETIAHQFASTETVAGLSTALSNNDGNRAAYLKNHATYLSKTWFGIHHQIRYISVQNCFGIHHHSPDLSWTNFRATYQEGTYSSP